MATATAAASIAVHPANVARIALAEVALNACAVAEHGCSFADLHEDDQTYVVRDLLCNLRHYWKSQGLDFARLDAFVADDFATQTHPDYAGS